MRTNPEFSGGATSSDRTGLPTGDVAEALAHPRRRLVVASLRTRPGPTTEGRLARSIRDREPGDDRPPAAVALRHRHLPKLAAVDLVDWDREASTVSLSARGPLDRPQLRAVTSAATGAPDPAWDEVLPAVARSRRRAVIGALATTDGSRTTADLAAALGPEGRSAEDGARDAAVRRVATALQHVDLPVLAEIGLVDFDPTAGTVSLRDHPALAWLADGELPGGRPPTPVGIDADD